MFSLAIIKYCHVICGVTLVGLIVAGFFYVLHSHRQRQAVLLTYALRSSLYLDGVVLLLVLLQFATAGLLLPRVGLSLQLPWIRVAYIAFSLVSLLWLVTVVIKWMSLLKRRLVMPSLYVVINILVMIVFFIIVHDAVMQRTWFA